MDRLLQESGAILKGHFLLTSGRHSETYFEKFRLLEQPQILSALCERIAEHFSRQEITTVAGPTTGGIIIAFEVARQMGLNALYVESEEGKKKLRRGAAVGPANNVLVVDDVLTTGKSVLEVAGLIRASGATLSGVAVLIDRSEQPVEFGCPFFAAHRVTATSYAPEQVPDWLSQIPISKPGTRS